MTEILISVTKDSATTNRNGDAERKSRFWQLTVSIKWLKRMKTRKWLLDLGIIK